MPERTVKYYWIQLQRVFRKLARSSGTPEHIAAGVMIGMFVGMTPTVGLQMIIAAAIATLLKANRVAAIVPVWITNPVTIVPIYLFNYKLGHLITGGPGVGEVEKVIVDVTNADGIRDGINKLMHLGWDIQLPLWTGCFLAGIILGLPSYYLTVRAVKLLRHELHLKRSAREERIQKILSENSGYTETRYISDKKD